MSKFTYNKAMQIDHSTTSNNNNNNSNLNSLPGSPNIFSYPSNSTQVTNTTNTTNVRYRESASNVMSAGAAAVAANNNKKHKKNNKNNNASKTNKDRNNKLQLSPIASNTGGRMGRGSRNSRNASSRNSSSSKHKDAAAAEAAEEEQRRYTPSSSPDTAQSHTPRTTPPPPNNGATTNANAGVSAGRTITTPTVTSLSPNDIPQTISSPVFPPLPAIDEREMKRNIAMQKQLLTIGTKVILCVTMALCSTFCILILLIVASSAQDAYYTSLLAIALHCDSVINALSLVMQWPFGDKIYKFICVKPKFHHFCRDKCLRAIILASAHNLRHLERVNSVNGLSLVGGGSFYLKRASMEHGLAVAVGTVGRNSTSNVAVGMRPKHSPRASSRGSRGSRASSKGSRGSKGSKGSRKAGKELKESYEYGAGGVVAPNGTSGREENDEEKVLGIAGVDQQINLDVNNGDEVAGTHENGSGSGSDEQNDANGLPKSNAGANQTTRLPVNSISGIPADTQKNSNMNNNGANNGANNAPFTSPEVRDGAHGAHGAHGTQGSGDEDLVSTDENDTEFENTEELVKRRETSTETLTTTNTSILHSPKMNMVHLGLHVVDEEDEAYMKANGMLSLAAAIGSPSNKNNNNGMVTAEQFGIISASPAARAGVDFVSAKNSRGMMMDDINEEDEDDLQLKNMYYIDMSEARATDIMYMDAKKKRKAKNKSANNINNNTANQHDGNDPNNLALEKKNSNSLSDLGTSPSSVDMEHHRMPEPSQIVDNMELQDLTFGLKPKGKRGAPKVDRVDPDVMKKQPSDSNLNFDFQDEMGIRNLHGRKNTYSGTITVSAPDITAFTRMNDPSHLKLVTPNEASKDDHINEQNADHATSITKNEGDENKINENELKLKAPRVTLLLYELRDVLATNCDIYDKLESMRQISKLSKKEVHLSFGGRDRLHQLKTHLEYVLARNFENSDGERVICFVVSNDYDTELMHQIVKRVGMAKFFQTELGPDRYMCHVIGKNHLVKKDFDKEKEYLSILKIMYLLNRSNENVLYLSHNKQLVQHLRQINACFAYHVKTKGLTSHDMEVLAKAFQYGS